MHCLDIDPHILSERESAPGNRKYGRSVANRGLLHSVGRLDILYRLANDILHGHLGSAHFAGQASRSLRDND